MGQTNVHLCGPSGCRVGNLMPDMPDHRITWHLDNWAEWMRDQRTDYGYGFSNTDGSGAVNGTSRDFDSMVAEADMRCAQAVDSLIDNLPVLQARAVCQRHIGAVFHCDRASMDEAYGWARVAIREGLRKKGIE